MILFCFMAFRWDMKIMSAVFFFLTTGPLKETQLTVKFLQEGSPDDNEVVFLSDSGRQGIWSYRGSH